MLLRVLAGLAVAVGALTACGPSAPIAPPVLTPAATPSTAPSDNPDVPTVHPAPPSIRPAKLAPVAIRIPAIGVDGHSISPMGLEPDHTLQVPPLDEPLVAGWYTGSPVPGNRGSAVVVAHVDGNHEKGLFWSLSKLKSGNPIFVDRSDGQTAEFRVTSVGKYCKESADCVKGEKPFPTALVYSNQSTPELHLITCGGRFDAKNKNYLENWVVVAKLVGMTQMRDGAN